MKNLKEIPIYQNSTFELPFPDITKAHYAYSRRENPTREYLETLLSKLDNSKVSFAVNSGTTALHTGISLLKSGSHVICAYDSYGGTSDILNSLVDRNILSVTYVKMNNLIAVENSILNNTKMIIIETPSNPTQIITDINAIVKMSKKHNIITMIDNTSGSSLFQKPCNLGIDISIQSATKYLCGHSDLIAGVISTNNYKIISDIKKIIQQQGTALQPQDSWLLTRSLKTLDIRHLKQQQNAIIIANNLNKHNAIKKVFYIGLEEHQEYNLHKSQSTGFGSVVSITTGSIQKSIKFIDEIKHFFKVTASFGSVSCSVSIPSKMSHYNIFKNNKNDIPFPEDLIRLSIGIENENDILFVLNKALDKIS